MKIINTHSPVEFITVCSCSMSSIIVKFQQFKLIHAWSIHINIQSNREVDQISLTLYTYIYVCRIILKKEGIYVCVRTPDVFQRETMFYSS